MRDKVMRIRNNYNQEVFNRDASVIKRVDLEEQTISVRYDERVVEYDVTELDKLVLAYATTIHARLSGIRCTACDRDLLPGLP